jgi:alkylation response protein AidB-like acyl-CoA dehydrogenase
MNDRESELVAAVRSLAREKFAARAAGYDREGAFAHENVAELKALGVPGHALPVEHGGLGMSVETTVRIMEEVAYADGSTAVALNMHVLIADALANMPPFPRRNVVLEDIGKNGALICGPGSVPTGELDDRKSGYRAIDRGDDLVLSGKAGFASMSDGATYAFLGASIPRDGDEPDVVLALPRLDTPGLKVLGNWDAMGLRATASHDIVCEDMVIPKSEALVVPAPILRAFVEAQQGGAAGLTQQRARGALGILGIWLGLAQAAHDFTVEYVAQRHGYLAVPVTVIGTPPGYRSQEPWAQMGIGEMEHWLQTGRIILYDTVRRLETPFPDQQSFVRHLVLTVYHLRRMAEEVAMGSMRVCGAHAYVRNRPLERIFRDLVGGAVMAWKTDQLVQTLGQGALGLPVTIVGPAGA